MGVRSHEALVELLEEDLYEKSLSVIEDGERKLVDDTPEAYVQREIGVAKEKKKHKQKRANYLGGTL